MINVSLWQIVLFVLAGVAVGAVVTILTMARGSRPDKPVTATADQQKSSQGPAKIEPDAEQSQYLREERVKGILKDCIAKQRNLTVGEAAKIMDVSPRRVRRLMDSGTLISVPTTDGSRLVSSVSVLDLVVRKGEPKQAKPAREQVSRTTNVSASEEIVLGTEVEGGLKPGPNQLYWYYVEGQNKPLRSIREALKVMGLDYAYTDWAGIPRHVRDKMRRERVTVVQ